MDYYDDMDDVPERDASNTGYHAGDELLGHEEHHGPNVLMKTSMAAFNQQRTIVTKLNREDLEDRYLRLLEENVVLKKHAVKQEEKIKKLATKLIRVMSDKKRMELGGSNASNIRGHRDLETEELIEDQQQRIRELERVNTQLKDKLTVAKQQIMAVNQQTPSYMKQKRSGSTIPRSVMGNLSPQPTPSLLMPSPTPTSHQQLLSQQAQLLLEEARNENRMLEESINMLKEQVNMLELDVEQTHEQAKIKEANYEEELSILKEQLKERNYQDVAENIELIRLQQDKKAKINLLTTMKAQVQAFEEEVTRYKVDIEKLKAENAELSNGLAEEQRKAINLASELTNNSSSRQALTEAEEKLRDLQKENAILRESNARLLDSAYNVERERQFAAAENALKVQVAQLEATLKADLNDKKLLSEALENERKTVGKLEEEFQDLQSRYFTLKESMEGHEEKLKFFAQENSIDAGELEQALLYLRQRSSSIHTSSKTSSKIKQGSFPDFLETADDSALEDTDGIKTLRAELSQVQAHHVEAVNELEKTRSLLRVQANINQEQKHEIEALQQRLFQVKAEFQSQIGEYKKLLDMRAARIQKLELQLRDSTYGQVSRQVNVENLKSHTVHTPSGQSLFEIHIQRVNLTKECLLHINNNEPRIFATWTFYEHDMQYTPVIKGSQPSLDCSAYYKVKLDDSFLDFLMDSSVLVEIHMTVETDEKCKTIGQAELKFSEVVHYPSNKLHGSVLAHSNPSGSQREPIVIGSLDFWFKLHTANTSRIQDWLDHREEVQRTLENIAQDKKTPLNEVDLLKGEDKAIHFPENQTRLSGRRRKPSVPEPVSAPVIQKRKTEETPPSPQKEIRTRPQNLRARRLVKSKGTVVSSDSGETKSEKAVEPTDQPAQHVEQAPEEHEKVEEKPEERPEKPPMMIREKTFDKGASDVEKRSDHSGKSSVEKRSNQSGKSSVEKVEEPSKAEKIQPIENPVPVPKPRGPIQVISSRDSSDRKENTPDEEPIKKLPEPKIEEKKEAFVKAETREEEEEVSEEDSEEESEEEIEEEEEEEESDEVEEDVEDEEEESEDESESEEESDEEYLGMENKNEPSEKDSSKDEDDESSARMVQPSSRVIRRVRQLAKEDSDTTITGDSSSTTHDSEGVVVRKDSIGGSRSSIIGSEAITITISEFKAGKNASFLKSKKIQKLFVEFSFLDLKPEDSETPFALPKPKVAGESIVFNYSKVVPMGKQEQAARRKLLAKILKQEEKSSGKSGKKLSKNIIFTLVSEPEESEDGKCEDVGTATVDLETLYKSERDLVDANLDVHSVDPQTRVSKFLGSKKIIGTLTVSVLAADVFKSLTL